MRRSKQDLPITRRYWPALTLFLVLLACFHGSARAQTYPDRTVKIIVPFPAGGTADLIPRVVGEWLSRK